MSRQHLFKPKTEKFSLLVSNVGWVRRWCPNREEVEALYESYVESGDYEQVIMWSSEEDDPIREHWIPSGEDCLFDEEL